jgi:KDO2-lipid IV(A) lauroyltransferase
MLRKIRYSIEAVIILLGLLMFRLLPLDMASAFGGVLGQVFGPFFRAHRTAQINIAMALPELTDRQRSRILSEMWNNLGRVIGEYPHLSRPMLAQRITMEGREHVEVVKASGKGSLFISGHFANWEIAPLTASLGGLPLVLIYRAANNPVADRIIRYIRSRYNLSMHNKGREGATEALRALKENLAVGMLVDQKMNDGSPVPFFGRDAMTATAVASIAIKQQVPLLAARVVRTDGAHFHVTIMPPVMFDPKADAKEAMADINKLFEGWIREKPAQWFWVHNRWNNGK